MRVSYNSFSSQLRLRANHPLSRVENSFCVTVHVTASRTSNSWANGGQNNNRTVIVKPQKNPCTFQDYLLARSDGGLTTKKTNVLKMFFSNLVFSHIGRVVQDNLRIYIACGMVWHLTNDVGHMWVEVWLHTVRLKASNGRISVRYILCT